MDYESSEFESRPLSVKAKNSSLGTFLRRVGLSVLVAPLGGYLLGLAAEQVWPGEISWAIVLLLLGLNLGFINLWAWMKSPKAP